MSEAVLVTGGLGLVGSETVKRLAADGRQVVVADIDTPANRKKARALPAGAKIRWVDLTNAADVDRLLSEVVARRDHSPGRDHPARRSTAIPRPRAR